MPNLPENLDSGEMNHVSSSEPSPSPSPHAMTSDVDPVAVDDPAPTSDQAPLATSISKSSSSSSLTSASGSVLDFETPPQSPADKKKSYLLDTDPKIAKSNDRDDSTLRFKYLLALSPLFRYFIDLSASKDAAFKRRIREIDSKLDFKPSESLKNKKRRKTEKEEDAELLMEEEEVPEATYPCVTESPLFVQQGKLREYQVQGLNWMISLYDNKLSGILADEMGLGKTLQTISFLGYLRYVRNVRGPHIVIVPKSTLDNWRREFAKWTPEVKVVVLQGSKEARAEIISSELLTCKFDVLVTSFELVIREKSALKKFRWEYIIVDEAHRIKNEESSLSKIIRLFYSRNRLLITGTPLQNNLHELWALLNFLLPDVFGDSEVFDEWFENQGNADATHGEEGENSKAKVVEQLHELLSPFLLRRVKNEVEKSLLPKIETNVYIGMTNMQVEWYKKLLEKDIDAVNGAIGKREGNTRLLNIVMQLRKCCNHPYLFDGAEPGPPFTTDEHLVFNTGKMIVLDKMLKKFQREGSRVLIFLQMSRLLDILEDYCFLRDFDYCRIDGSTSHEDRIEAIDLYNDPESEKFVFLLTTRAGGLGINLTSADIVILYDSDWNPQADLQAMDRAHRIGQKKQVKVFRFVTENAIEEKVLDRAAQKLRLDQLVIQQGRHHGNASTIGNNKEDLIGMIQHGARKVFDSQGSGHDLLDEDIEEILQKGAAKTASMNEKLNKLEFEDLQSFSSTGNAYEWNGHNFAKKEASNALGTHWINPLKRERKEHAYSVDNYYKDVLKIPPSTKPAVVQKPKAPKAYNPQDHQFFSPDLIKLLDREQQAYKKEIGYRFSLEEFGDSDEEFVRDEFKLPRSRKQRRDAEQKKIDNAVPLNADESTLKEQLLAQSFHDWTRRDFTNFIHALAKHGRGNYELMSKTMGNKNAQEVERYSVKFWEAYTEIDGHEKYLAQVEASQRKLEKLQYQQQLLDQKIHEANDVLSDLKITYPPNNSKRIYSKVEDRFLLLCAAKHGLFSDNLNEKIKEEITNSDQFKFDWFFQSRTPQEIGRRVSTLLLALSKELEAQASRKTVPLKSDELDPTYSAALKRNGDTHDIMTELKKLKI